MLTECEYKKAKEKDTRERKKCLNNFQLAASEESYCN